MTRKATQYYAITRHTLAVLGLLSQISIHASSASNYHKNPIRAFTKATQALFTHHSHGQASFFMSKTLNANVLGRMFSKDAAHIFNQYQLKGFITYDQRQFMRLNNVGLKALFKGRLISLGMFATSGHSSALGFSINLTKGRSSGEQWFERKYMHQDKRMDNNSRDLLNVENLDLEDLSTIATSNNVDPNTFIRKNSLSWNEINKKTLNLDSQKELFNNFQKNSLEQEKDMCETKEMSQKITKFYDEECLEFNESAKDNIRNLNHYIENFHSSDEATRNSNTLLLGAKDQYKKVIQKQEETGEIFRTNKQLLKDGFKSTKELFAMMKKYEEAILSIRKKAEINTQKNLTTSVKNTKILARIPSKALFNFNSKVEELVSILNNLEDSLQALEKNDASNPSFQIDKNFKHNFFSIFPQYTLFRSKQESPLTIKDMESLLIVWTDFYELLKVKTKSFLEESKNTFDQIDDVLRSDLTEQLDHLDVEAKRLHNVMNATKLFRAEEASSLNNIRAMSKKAELQKLQKQQKA